MEELLKDFQLDLIETFSNEISLCSKHSSELLFTIKSIPKVDPRRLANVQKEVNFLKSAKILHKNIVKVLNTHENTNTHFTFFEPCPTGTLFSSANLDPISLFLQICQGVSYLHSKSIVIKTLSIHSILLQDQTPKLANFELAENENFQYFDTNDLSFVEDYWKAPEVQDSGMFSKKSDIWDLGLIFYYLVFRQQYQNKIPDTSKQYKEILSLTLEKNHEKRCNIQQLLKKLNEICRQDLRTLKNSACFTPTFLSSGRSTQSIVKNILREEIKNTNDKNLSRLITKVESSPAKISKFFKELQKRCENVSELVKIRALAVLFCYLQRAPLLTYTQIPGVFDLVLQVAQKKCLPSTNEEFAQVIQGFTLVILTKFYLIRQAMPKISGNFNNTSESAEDFSFEIVNQTLWYWETLQAFTDLLLASKDLIEARIFRLWVDEEQVHVFKFLRRLQNQSLLKTSQKFEDLVGKASVLFVQDNLKFPGNDVKVVSKPPNRRLLKFCKVDLEEKKVVNEESKFETVYKTANNGEQFSRKDIYSPANTTDTSILAINHSQLTYKQQIGIGISCEVFLGTYNKQKVAIKQPKSFETFANSEFQRELQVLQSLRHPNLVNYLGFCISPQCLVLEYCAGGDLFKLLHKRKDIHLSWVQRLKMAKDICIGMEYLHEHSFIHRDLKSLNLLLFSPINGPKDAVHVKISDFGLSRLYQEDSFMTGQLGTCHWMAPEVIKASKYTLKADVYSFAIVLYEILTREYPYRGKKQEEITQLVLNNNRPDVSWIPKDCPEALESLMKLCWDSSFESRPSFASIVKILDSIKVNN